MSFSMPWYITFVLFIIGPFYNMFVREKWVPTMSDWWAARSKSALRKRILQLQANVTYTKTIADTEGDLLERLYWGRTSTYLNSYSALVFLVIVGAAYYLPQPDLTEVDKLALLLSFMCSISMYLMDMFRKRRLHSGDKYRTTTQRGIIIKEIQGLVAKLKARGGDLTGIE